ncbi:enoyl-CoA hydratase/isomerase family protein [Allosphingosinicella flava]|uniref:Enoyl-CoA hydratase/isomerase family protein n=1 Tax=Allosphingosinicella flava TaxID=2771430 RepID=A0A7T2GL34_9SPHN|nr:enoyl-CoA hydratase/isomerase family protein [Sphingosinicella flava]QPQ55846.1 enoyl-CoA hydratase/isomerase family protein [Sphingosinicella flava]
MFNLTLDDGIARLRMNRPEARNAVPLAGWGMLEAALGEAEESGARVLVLSGVPGGAFCAGADISDFAGFADDAAAAGAFRAAMRRALDRLAGLSIPSVAVIEGACYGAGVAIAMACDIRVAATHAQMAITPAKLGISYPQEDIYRLVQLVGPGQAQRLLLSAAPVSGGEASVIGLAEIASDCPDEAAEALVRSIASFDPESLAALRRGVRLAGAGQRQDGEQDRLFDALMASEALAARVALRVKK